MTDPKKTKKQRVSDLKTYDSTSVQEHGRSRSISVHVSCYSVDRPEFSIEAGDYGSGLGAKIGNLHAETLREIVRACERALLFAQNRFLAERLILSDPTIPDDEAPESKPTSNVSPSSAVDDALPF